MVEDNPLVIDVCYYFEKKELSIEFRHAGRAAAYQALNREGRILSNEDANVYLPVSSGMDYIRDTSIGLVVGFTNKAAAEKWCRKSILGQMHSNTEVHVKRIWNRQELDQQLGIFKHPTPESGNARIRQSVIIRDKPPLRIEMPGRETPAPPSYFGPRRHAMTSIEKPQKE